MHKIVNGVEVEMTQEEVGVLEASREPARLKKEKNAWIENRKKAYGSIEDQLDFIVKNGVEAFRERNLKIKLDNPKPLA
jgi:hypothetical protein